jgi:hypothetical protein
VLLFVVAMAISGCGGAPPPPPNAQLHVEEIASWYQKYQALNGRQPPPDEATFVAFINKMMKEQGVAEGMRQDYLVSPRDGKKFVVRYGKPMSTDPTRNIVVYEQEGQDGKKWMANAAGVGREVDDAELKQLVGGK